MGVGGWVGVREKANERDRMRWRGRVGKGGGSHKVSRGAREGAG